MEYRWKILCSGGTELWGRGKDGRALKGNRVQAVGQAGRKNPWREGRLQAERKRVAKSPERPPRKAAIATYGPVPKTDTGRQVEETKADGRSIVKELGKITP